MELKNWKVINKKFDFRKINIYESIFSLSNGFIGIRGVEDEFIKGQSNGVYINGIYSFRNNKEVVNFPQFLQFYVKVNSVDFNLKNSEYSDYERSLDLKNGVLKRDLIWYTDRGKLAIITERFVSQVDKNLICQKYTIRSINFNGSIEIGNIVELMAKNMFGRRYGIKNISYGKSAVFLKVGIKNKKNNIYMDQIYYIEKNGKSSDIIFCDNRLKTKSIFGIKPGDYISIYKYTIIDKRKILKRQYDYNEEKQKNIRYWKNKWIYHDIIIDGPEEEQCGIRYSIFQMLQHSSFLDGKTSIGAKGLTGEHYNNHIFWDTEIFLLPFFMYSDLSTASNLLLYRYTTRRGAERNADKLKNKGIKYAWESADDGKEACPTRFWDPNIKQWVHLLESFQEIHITADIVYAIWKFYLLTNNRRFFLRYFGEIIILTVEYWLSRLIYNKKDDCYECKNVIGPDEYHRKIDNNFYTNYLIKNNFKIGIQTIELLANTVDGKKILEKYKINDNYINRLKNIIEKIKINFDFNRKIYEQFDGFFNLKEYKNMRENRQKRKAFYEILTWGKISQYKIIKQADVLMAMFLFREDFKLSEINRNFNYYIKFTAHDSSLSKGIHSILASWLGKKRLAYNFFKDSLFTDLKDKKNNSAYGLHAATWGSNWQAIVFGFAGLKILNNRIITSNNLPNNWKSLKFRIYYNNKWHRCCVVN